MSDINIVDKAFEMQADVEKFTPVSKQTFMKKAKKEERGNIIIPVEIDGKEQHLLCKYPTRLDNILAGSGIFSSRDPNDVQEGRTLDPEELISFACAYVQRLVLDPEDTSKPMFQIEELETLDEALVLDIQTKLIQIERGEETDTFREVDSDKKQPKSGAHA